MPAQEYDITTTSAGPDHLVRGSNQSGLRAYNERLVLTLIRQNGPLAKAGIARITGLSAQTVSVIMRALEADGLLEKGPPVRGKVGQPSVPMGLAKDGAFFLGLKIGRRSQELVLIDFLGQVQGRARKIHRYPQPDDVVKFAHEGIGSLLSELTPRQRARVAGLGIAIPFRLTDWASALGVSASDMDAWHDRDIAAEIGAEWDFPVYLQNDASAACGAELVFGHPDKPRDFLYIFMGFFVGGGLVLDNTLFTGRSGNAAALGSMPIGASDGHMRQLVEVASLATLERALAPHGFDTDTIWGNPTSWSVPEEYLDDWLERAAQGLAFAIASCACVIDFECTFIDGWLPPQIRARIVRRTQVLLDGMSVAGIDIPQIREGTIGIDARALGAASLPLSDRFLVDRSGFLKT